MPPAVALKFAEPVEKKTAFPASAPELRPRFYASPVFGRPGLPCEPDQEMLSVVQIAGNSVIPVDCIPLKNLGEADLSIACGKVEGAFSQARSALQVHWRNATRQDMAGWEITAPAGEQDAPDKNSRVHLDFVLEHFTKARVNDILRNRTREGAHRLLNLDLGPHYYSFLIQQMRPW